MEVKIIDFKHPIKPSTNSITKIDPWKKSKDFSSTLESINDKNTVQNQNNKASKKSNAKDFDDLNNSNIESNKTVDTEKDELELNKIDEIENEVSSDNAMLLLSNLIVVKDIPVKDENVEISTELDSELSVKTHISIENQVLEHDLESIDKFNIDKNISEETILEAVDGENVGKLEEKHDNNFAFDIDKKDIQLISSKKDEISGNVDLLSKADSSNSEEVSIEEVDFSSDLSNKIGIKDMENLNQQNSSDDSSENQEEVLVASQVEEDIELKDKPFVFLEKDGIKFVGDKVSQPEETVTVSRENLIEQIVDKVKVNLSDLKNEIKVSLKPEVLGELTMNIEIVKGEIIAKVMVDNQKTKEVIETNLLQLKEGIKDTGLEIKTFEVFVGSGSDFDKHNSGQFNLNKNNQKTKIKVQDNKSIKNYEEGSIDNKINSIGLYSENGLNLFA
jgi:hypothetical protein